MPLLARTTHTHTQQHAHRTAQAHAAKKAKAKRRAAKAQTAVFEASRVNNSNEHGWTALHHHASTGNVKQCKYLLSLGADINKRTTRGESPLDVAKKKKKGRVVALFKEKLAAEAAEQQQQQGEDDTEQMDIDPVRSHRKHARTHARTHARRTAPSPTRITHPRARRRTRRRR